MITMSRFGYRVYVSCSRLQDIKAAAGCRSPRGWVMVYLDLELVNLHLAKLEMDQMAQENVFVVVMVALKVWELQKLRHL